MNVVLYGLSSPILSSTICGSVAVEDLTFQVPSPDSKVQQGSTATYLLLDQGSTSILPDHPIGLGPRSTVHG